MKLSIAATQLIISSLFAFTTALSIFPIAPRQNGGVIPPSSAYQIYQADPDRTDNLGPDNDSTDTTSSSIASSSATSSSATSSSTFSSSSTNSSSTSLVSPTISITPTATVNTTPLSITPTITANTTLTSITPTIANNVTRVSVSPTVATNTTLVSITATVPTNATVLSVIPTLAPSPTVVSIPATIIDSTISSATDSSATSSPTSGGSKRLARSKIHPMPFLFHVSQDANNANAEDLVVSFKNLPCPPAAHGPYSFEFNFQPGTTYSSTGQNQINMFKINGDLPPKPTYNNIAAMTGNLMGTFELPTGSEAAGPKRIFINQLVCESTISLRFGITQSSPEAGAVAYLQQDGTGLIDRAGG